MNLPLKVWTFIFKYLRLIDITMIETLISSLILFLRKRSRKKTPLRITLINLLPTDKKNHAKGTISLCHCRGHNCVMLVCSFEGFYNTHVTLLSKNYYFR